jgi:hypothetical protein
MNRTTTQAQYRFVVKETGVGGYFLMLEPLDGTLPVLGDGFLSLTLRKDMTLDEARELAGTLNDDVCFVNYTGTQR